MKRRLKAICSILITIEMISSAIGLGVYAQSIGVATHKNYGFDTTKLVQKVNEVGSDWVRQDIAWSSVETNWGYSMPENIVEYFDAVKKEGGRTLGILGYGNTSAKYTNAGTTVIPTESNLDYYNGWLDYVEYVVTELKGKVDAYEIWNEPDNEYFNGGSATPAEYAKLVEDTYELVKSIDPNVVVLAGAFLGSNSGTATSEKYTDGREYIYQFLKTTNEYKTSKGIYPFDAISIHTYPQTKDGTTEAEVSGSLSWFKSPWDDMGYKGDVWITEWGYYTGSANKAYSEDNQATVMLRTAVALDKWYKENNVSGEKFYYEIVDTGTDESNSEHNFGLFKNDVATAKKSAKTMELYNRFISDKQMTSVDFSKSLGLMGYYKGYYAEYSSSTGKTYVMWDVNNNSSYIKLSDLDAYSSVTLYDYQGNSTQITDSTYKANVSSDPIFVVCENKAATIIDSVYDAENNKILISGRGYLIDNVTVKLKNNSGKVIEAQTVEIDEDGYFRADMNATLVGTYQVTVGEGEIENYATKEVTVSTDKPMLSGVVAVMDGASVTVSANVYNCDDKKVSVVVLPKDVSLEEATFDDYIYLDQKEVTDNNLFFAFTPSSKVNGDVRVYLSALDTVKDASAELEVPDYIEVGSFDISEIGGTITVTATDVSSREMDLSESIIVVAQYKGEQLVKIDISEKGLENKSKTFTTTMMSEADTVNAFLWNNEDDIIPLAGAVSPNNN